jgi:hypothetical protein
MERRIIKMEIIEIITKLYAMKDELQTIIERLFSKYTDNLNEWADIWGYYNESEFVEEIIFKVLGD